MGAVLFGGPLLLSLLLLRVCVETPAMGGQAGASSFAASTQLCRLSFSEQQGPSLLSGSALCWPGPLTRAPQPCRWFALQVGKAVGSEGLVAGQIVDIKSEGAGQKVGIETLQVRAGVGSGMGGWEAGAGS